MDRIFFSVMFRMLLLFHISFTEFTSVRFFVCKSVAQQSLGDISSVLTGNKKGTAFRSFHISMIAYSSPTITR